MPDLAVLLVGDEPELHAGLGHERRQHLRLALRDPLRTLRRLLPERRQRVQAADQLVLRPRQAGADDTLAIIWRGREGSEVGALEEHLHGLPVAVGGQHRRVEPAVQEDLLGHRAAVADDPPPIAVHDHSRVVVDAQADLRAVDAQHRVEGRGAGLAVGLRAVVVRAHEEGEEPQPRDAAVLPLLLVEGALRLRQRRDGLQRRRLERVDGGVDFRRGSGALDSGGVQRVAVAALRSGIQHSAPRRQNTTGAVNRTSNQMIAPAEPPHSTAPRSIA